RAGALHVAPDPGEQPLDAIAQALQGRREEEPVLEAIAAAPAIDQLGLDARQADGDPAAQHDVDALEAARVPVRAKQVGERLGGRRTVALVGDAPQVSAEVEFLDGPFAGDVSLPEGLPAPA